MVPSTDNNADQGNAAKAQAHPRPPVREEDLRHWNLLDDFARALARHAPAGEPTARAAGGPERELTRDIYFRSFLFAQLNPILDSMRGLCAASDLRRVQLATGARHLSLGSFSEAQHVFDPALLGKVFAGLLAADPDALGGPGSRQARLLAIDSTVLAAVPRMEWAEWRHQSGKTQRAARLHLKFNVLDGLPAEALVTEGRTCERKAFEAMARPGEFYLGDRNYGRDYGLLAALDEAGCGYVIRLCASANVTVLRELPLSDEDLEAGVVSDRLVRIGSRKRWQHGTVRLITIDRDDLDEPILVVTNRLDPATHSAALLAALYRERWKIELFFRWFKCVLGRPDQWHWMAESRNGATMQVYLALIAALLLARRTGKLPTKRQMELLRFHAAGMAELDEILPGLGLGTRKRRS